MEKPIFVFIREEDSGQSKLVSFGKDLDLKISFEDWGFQIEPVGANTLGSAIPWPKDPFYDRYAVLVCKDSSEIKGSLHKQHTQTRMVFCSSSFKMHFCE